MPTRIDLAAQLALRTREMLARLVASPSVSSGDPAIELLVLEKVSELRAAALSRKG